MSKLFPITKQDLRQQVLQDIYTTEIIEDKLPRIEIPHILIQKPTIIKDDLLQVPIKLPIGRMRGPSEEEPEESTDKQT